MTELALIDTQLFVYGTLAPGRANEHQLDCLEGTWVQARVRGYLFEAGWGAAQGFPGIRLDNEGLEGVGVVVSIQRFSGALGTTRSL